MTQFDPDYIYDQERIRKLEMEMQDDKDPSGAVKTVALLITLAILAVTIPFFAHLYWIIAQWAWGLIG